MKKHILLAVMIMQFLGIKAQLFSESTLTPVSPNSASLGTYGYYDASLYTGSINIPIPIYTINLDGKDFPITLSYQSSGTKVAQEASWVGLGWTLNVGGAIVRNLRGIDDFANGGFYWDKNTPWDTDSGEMKPIRNEDSLQDYLLYLEGTRDTEPDIFYFNCGNMSGNMFFGKNETLSRNGVIAKPLINTANHPLNITYNTKSKSWIIKDGEGYIYYLGTKEETINYSERFELFQGEIGERIMNRAAPPIITSWLLDSIESPKNNKVYFQYKVERIYTPIQMTEEGVVLDKINQFGGKGEIKQSVTNYVYSNAEIKQYILSTVKFDDGIVNFQTTDRSDIRCPSSLLGNKKAQKLSSLIVCDMQNNIIKRFGFDYHYLGKEGYDGRLLLDSLIEIEGDNTLVHKFKYNENGYLPPKYSIRTDEWGFYNGSNISNDPNIFKAIPTIIKDGKILKSGPNKNFSESLAAIGMLEAIEYPTGGSSKFFYETHLLRGSNIQVIKPFKVGFVDNYDIDKDKYIMNKPLVSQPFDIEGEVVEMTITSGYDNPFKTEHPENPSIFYDIELLKWDGTKYYSVALSDEVKIDNTRANTFVIPVDKIEHPIKGKYCLRIRSVRCIALEIETYVFAALKYSKKVEDKESQFGAGLRIAKVVTKESPMSREEIKQYKYSDAVPMETFSHTVLTHLKSYGESPDSYDLSYYVCQSNTYTPFLSMGKSSIGYSQVTELSDAGSITFNYKNISPPRNLLWPGMPTIPNFGNGLVSSIEVRNKNNQLVKQESLIYTNAEQITIIGLNAFACSIFPTSPSYLFNTYPINIQNWRLLKKDINTYIDNDSLTESFRYGYDSYLQINSETVHNSKGDKVNNMFKFPNDYSDSIFQKMVDKNMISVPVESISMINDNVVKSKKTVFKDTLNMILPFQIHSFKSSLPRSLDIYSNYYEIEQTFYKYDNRGNILETVDNNNLQTVYLWDIKQKYPIAIIKNCSYNEAKSVFTDYNMSGIALPNINQEHFVRANLPQAQINTYTYKPLVGIATVTVPKGVTFYYEYDVLGRLAAINNYNRNIVKQFHYKYYNQSIEEEPEKDKYCNVTFDTSAPGGDGTIKTVKMKYGEPLPTPTPAPGYRFEGWYDGDTKFTNVPNSPNRTITGKFVKGIKDNIINVSVKLDQTKNGIIYSITSTYKLTTDIRFMLIARGAAGGYKESPDGSSRFYTYEWDGSPEYITLKVGESSWESNYFCVGYPDFLYQEVNWGSSFTKFSDENYNYMPGISGTIHLIV